MSASSVVHRSGAGVTPHATAGSTQPTHGVCWAAIIAGAAGAAVLSLILLLLGTGIGFAAVSPWGDRGVTTPTVAFSTIAWMTIVQILASILGGYLAGRLRGTWVSVHSHESYFRDTAHGFLAWAVATLVTATLLSSAVGALVSGGVKAGAAVAGGAVTVAGAGAAGVAGNAASSPGNDPMSYFTDALLRQPAGQGAPSGDQSNPSSEVGRIFATSLKNGSLSSTDSEYLAQVVARRTGISAEDAQKRVGDVYAQAQQSIEDTQVRAKAAVDAARKASATLSLWLVVSLLLGAFTASWAATVGGRLRDGLETVAG